MAQHETDDGDHVSAGDVAHWVPPILLSVLVLAFALANTDSTKVDYVFGDTEAPLIVVLLATAVVGALIAALLRHRRRD